MGEDESAGTIDFKDVMRVVRLQRKRPEAERENIRAMAADVGRVRPKMNPEEEERRREALMSKKMVVEAWAQTVPGQEGKTIVGVKVGDRKISTELEPQYFMMLGILKSGEYRKYMNFEEAGKLVMTKWIDEVLKGGGERNGENNDQLPFDENPIPREIAEEIRGDTRYQSQAERRAAVGEKYRKTPN